MHGVVLASDSSQLLRPAILWADTRSSARLSAYLTDVLRIALYATTVAAASARGAALLAGIGISVYADTKDTLKLAATPTLAPTPQSVNSAREEAWMRYQSLYPHLKTLSSIYYLLKLEGDFKASIYREVNGENNREIICEQKLEKFQFSDPVKISTLNLLQNEKAGRIYFEITCCSE